MNTTTTTTTAHAYAGCRTVIEALLNLDRVETRGARFLQPPAAPAFYSYADVLCRARAAAAGLQARGLRPGDRVAVILPTGVGFFDTFLGTILAGGVPAALYPPFRLGALDEYFVRSSRMLRGIGARFLVTDKRIRTVIGPALAGVATLDEVIDVADLASDAAYRPVAVDPASPAYLQFSSGTTVDPKAVIVSHTNLLANVEMISRYLHVLSDEETARGGVSWLPLYHDMGLLGCVFTAMLHPITVTYMGPEVFIARPVRWLQALSEYGAAVSAAPNFAYGLCAAKVRDEDLRGVDLSRWRFALNGAEAIDVAIMQRFIDRFAAWGFRPEAMTPVYGMAEAGLAVTFSDPSVPVVTEFDRDALAESREARPGVGRVLPSVGRPLEGLEVGIRDGGRPLPDGRVGEIVVRGPSITPGYFNDPEKTAATIRDGWLHTGDLGFLHDGQLYISGRQKDLIIIRGRNYAPQEIEELIAEAPGVRMGCAVALGHVAEGAGEQLIVVVERDPRAPQTDDEVRQGIRDRVVAGLALAPDRIEIAPRGALPRTSSGKLQRSLALKLLLEGRLAAPGRVRRSKLAWAVVRSRVALGWLRVRKGLRRARA